MSAARGPGRPKSKTTQYRVIADDLAERIRKGEWKSGKPLPSLREVARRYGVSDCTVRWSMRLLEVKGFIARDPVNGRRIVHFDPAQAPLAHARPVVLVYPAFFGPRWELVDDHTLLDATIHAVTADHSPLTIARGLKFRDRMPPDILRDEPKAVVLTGHFQNEILDAYAELPVPVILLDQPAEGRAFHCVCVDNRAAGRDAVRRLLALGHERIAFTRLVLGKTRKVDPDSRERQDGYEEGLREAGQKDTNSDVINMTLPIRKTGAGIRGIIDPRRKITACICCDTGHASVLRQALEESGRSVPEDFSIVAFSNQGGQSPFSGPRSDFARMGDAVLNLIARPKHPPRTEALRATWHEGQTIGPPPA